jgi:MFS family permease
MQTFSTTFGMFIGGKILLGLSTNFQLLTAPVLVADLAHPANRVFVTSLYNTNIFIGLIIDRWVTFGTYRIDSNWSWMRMDNDQPDLYI